MTSIGENLRRERLRRNLDLDSVSRELKISSRFLEAIEAEKFDKLPGGVFARSFVRQYARLLGMNEEEAAAAVQGALEQEPEIPNLRRPRRLDRPAFTCRRSKLGMRSAAPVSNGRRGCARLRW